MGLNWRVLGFQVMWWGGRGLLVEEEEAWTPQEPLSTASLGGGS